MMERIKEIEIKSKSFSSEGSIAALLKWNIRFDLGI